MMEEGQDNQEVSVNYVFRKADASILLIFAYLHVIQYQTLSFNISFVYIQYTSESLHYKLYIIKCG
jgi:hypothetical protein